MATQNVLGPIFSSYGAAWEILGTLNREQGITFLFSTHDPRLLERVDRVVHHRG